MGERWRWRGGGGLCWHFTNALFHVFPQGSEVGWNSILTVTAAAAVMLLMANLLRALVRCWLDGQQPYTGTDVCFRPALDLSCHVYKLNWNSTVCMCLTGRYYRHRRTVTWWASFQAEDRYDDGSTLRSPHDDWSRSTKRALVSVNIISLSFS